MLPVSRPDQVARFTVVKAIAKAVLGVILGGTGLGVLLLGIQGVGAGQGAARMGVLGRRCLRACRPRARAERAHLPARNGLSHSVDVQIEPKRARPGASLGLSLRLLPRRAFSVTGVSATLVGREVAVVGRGTSRTRYEHDFHREQRPIGAAQAARPSMPVVAAGDLRVPDGAPHSFKLSGSDGYWEIEWSVRLQVHVRWFPNWVRDYPILVGP